MAIHCAGCRSVLAADDLYCPECGRITRAHAARADAAAKQRLVDKRGASRRAFAAVAIGFLVPTVAPLLTWVGVFGSGSAGGSVAPVLIMTTAQLIGIGLLLLLLGRADRMRVFASRIPLSAWSAAPLIGAFALGISAAWVTVLRSAAGVTDTSTESLDGVQLVAVLLIAPLLEEILCRGLIWQAVAVVIGRTPTALVTATVFALLHLQNGGLLLELPHRFLAGLFFGWLRLHGGSMWPCVLAHAVLNAGAVFLTS